MDEVLHGGMLSSRVPCRCRKGVEWEEVEDLAAVAADVDVLYQTRIQKATFETS